jgi:hypothetical protein
MAKAINPSITTPSVADHRNLSPSRTSDGNSKDPAAILAVTPAADRRSDKPVPATNHASIASLMPTSRRGFLMNTIVSTASLATAAAVTAPSVVGAEAPDQGSDSLIAIERDMLRYEREATEVRKFLADVTRRSGELKDEPRWKELRGDWHRLDDHASEIEERTCAVMAANAEGIKAKQRVATWLRTRAPGLDRADFAQRVIDSIRDDALAMAVS